MNRESKILLSQIEHALAEGADTAARQRGADAAKTLHVLLGAIRTPLASPAQETTPLGQMVQQLKSTPQAVILDALIAKLTSYLPKDAPPSTPSAGMRVPFVPIPSALKEPGEGGAL